MSDVRLKILPPWSTYINKLQEMFDPDPQIAFNVDWSGNHPSVTLATNNPEKATALSKLLPSEKVFGNVKLLINIDCPTMSNIAFKTPKELFETAFYKNPIFAYAVSPADEGYYFFSMTYIVFKNRVAQFFNDNLNDPHGVISTLYQDIATEIFEDAGLNGVYYATDIEQGKLGMPLGEWP